MRSVWDHVSVHGRTAMSSVRWWGLRCWTAVSRIDVLRDIVSVGVVLGATVRGGYR